MQWWFILQSTKYICFNAAFEILFRPAQFHEQSVQPSTQQTFDQHLVQACQWKQHIHNSYPTQQLTPTSHLPGDFTVPNQHPTHPVATSAGRTATRIWPWSVLTASRSFAWASSSSLEKTGAFFPETGCFHGRKPPMYGHVNAPYFILFSYIQHDSTIHFCGIILSHSEMNGRSCRVQTYRCLSPQKIEDAHLNTFFSDQGRPGNRWRPSPLLCEFVGWILRPAPYCFALGRGLFNPLTSAGGILNFQDLILCLGRSWLSPEEFVGLVKNIPRMISVSYSMYFLCSSLLRHGSPFDSCLQSLRYWLVAIPLNQPMLHWSQFTTAATAYMQMAWLAAGMLVCMNALYMLSFFFVGNSHLFAPTSRSLSHLAKD